MKVLDKVEELGLFFLMRELPRNKKFYEVYHNNVKLVCTDSEESGIIKWADTVNRVSNGTVNDTVKRVEGVEICRMY